MAVATSGVGAVVSVVSLGGVGGVTEDAGAVPLLFGAAGLPPPFGALAFGRGVLAAALFPAFAGEAGLAGAA